MASDSDGDNRQRKYVIDNAVERELKEFRRLRLDQILQDLERLSWDLVPYLKVSSMAAVGPGVFELKQNGSPAYRLLYAKFPGELVVLAARAKTTQGNDRTLIDVAKKRLAAHRAKTAAESKRLAKSAA